MKFSWKNIENWGSWKSQFFWVGHLKIIFFCLVHIYRIARFFRNFDDYLGFQPKISQGKHFCPECTSPSTHFVTLYLLLLLHAAEWKFPFYLPDGAEIFAHRVIYTDFRMITNSRYLNANYETSPQNSFKKGNLPWVDGFQYADCQTEMALKHKWGQLSNLWGFEDATLFVDIKLGKCKSK